MHSVALALLKFSQHQHQEQLIKIINKQEQHQIRHMRTLVTCSARLHTDHFNTLMFNLLNMNSGYWYHDNFDDCEAGSHSVRYVPLAEPVVASHLRSRQWRLWFPLRSCSGCGLHHGIGEDDHERMLLVISARSNSIHFH